ncbi:MAG: sensor histidine kinase, partial [Fulvivirga sp.]
LLILHLSFWLLFVSYRLFDFTRYLPFEMAVFLIGVPLVFNVLISYIHYFWLLPILIQKKEVLKYVLLLILLIIVMSGLRFTADVEFLKPISRDEEYYSSIHFARVLSVVWDFMTFLIFTGMIKFTVDWFYMENRRKQLENEKLNAELNYLKSQINPHFLFNTLHNLNYLTLSKRNEASDVIIRLSNIMRYMIYDASKATVPIKKEIEYMKDYIELERIRLNRSFELTFNVDAHADNLQIAPLMLITFLENAFKHGVSDKESGCWITLDLDYTKGMLHYRVSNSRLRPDGPKAKSGFGLKNLEDRLRLQYPENHQLSISENDQEFVIDLTIRLNES